MDQIKEGYAPNADNAEKANNSPSVPSASPYKSKFDPEDEVNSQSTGTRGKKVKKNSRNVRSNAKIWSLYLEEAEKEAKELVEVLNNSLESLLLFAGLFAGIVASFVIDSRQDLQPDPQQVLLIEIRNALRNEAAPQDIFKPSTSSLWINGLWFASLMITLISAIIGVLAKSWLVKFAPAVHGQESSDAYRRWIRDDQAKRWYLAQMITAAPLLIQVALFLFSIGFGIQSLDDNQIIGWVILALVILGVAFYGITTLLPIFFPGCPLHTPLSDLLSGLLRLWHDPPPGASENTQTHLSLRYKTDEEILLEIWKKMLTHPTKSSNVDEALAELTRRKPDDMCWKELFEWKRIPDILCERFLHSITFGPQRQPRYEILCSHLRSLLGFVNYLEKSKPDDCIRTLKKFLIFPNPLNRWNVFPEEIRALAFTARTLIMIPCGGDYAPSEMEEQPWETIVRDMPPDHRGEFAMAACRGLAKGKKRLQKVSAFSIALYIAKNIVAETGPKSSEWGVGIIGETKAEVKKLGRQYLAELFKIIASGWKGSLLETLSNSPSSSTSSDLWDITIIGGLGSWVRNQNPKIRAHAVGMLKTLVIDNDFGHAVELAIPDLVHAIVNDPNEDIRANARDVLMNMVRNEELQACVTEVLPESLHSALNASGSRPRLCAINNIAMFVQQTEFQAMFENSAWRLKALVSDFVNLAVRDWNKDVREAGMKAVESIAQDEGIRENVKLLLTERWTLTFRAPLKDRMPRLERLAEADALTSLMKDESFRDLFKQQFSEDIKEAVKILEPETRSSIINSLGKLINKLDIQDTFEVMAQELFRVVVHDIFGEARTAGAALIISTVQSTDFANLSSTENLEPESNKSDQWALIHVLNMSEKYLQFREVIQQVVPNLVEMAIKNEDGGVRAAAVNLVGSLVQDGTFRDTIRNIVLEILDLVPEDLHSQVRIAWCKMLVTLAKDSAFHSSVKSELPKLIEMTSEVQDDGVRATGLSSLTSIAQTGIFLDSIKDKLIDIIIIGSSLKKDHLAFRIAWAEALPVLIKIPDFQNAIKEGIPKLATIVAEDTEENGCVAGVKSLVALANEIPQMNNTAMQDAIKSELPKGLESASRDSRRKVRIAWLDELITLARNSINDFKRGGAAEPVVSKTIEICIKDDDKDIRLPMFRLLSFLAEKGVNFYCVVKSTMQQILTVAVKDDDDDVRKAAEELLKNLQISRDDEDEENIESVGDIIISVVPSTVVFINPGEHEIRQMIELLMKFAAEPIKRKDMTEELERTLKPMLKESSWLAQATAAEFIGVLREYCNDGECPLRQYIQSTIPDIIHLVLENKNDDVRAAGIRSLANLADSEDNPFRNKIKIILPEIMDLLKMSHLRVPVTELVSSLAIDDIVRKEVAFHITEPLISSKTVGVYPEELLELLSRLIIDKRLSRKQSSDEVILYVASVLLMRPHASAGGLRFKIAIALWCNYGVTYTDHHFPDDLVDLFLSTIFGSHTTMAEVDKWLEMGLPHSEPGKTIAVWA